MEEKDSVNKVSEGADKGRERGLRGVPASFELSESQYKEIVKKTEPKDKPVEKFNPVLVEHHDEIEKMLRDGVTKRVIHTKLGVSRYVLQRYIDARPELTEAWNDAQEDLLDLNEEIVSELAALDCSMTMGEEGSFPRYDGRSLATKFNAAKLRLERLGGRRGWNPKLETNEVGNGGRAPVIFVGEVTDSMILQAEAENKRVYEEAVKGLENIPRG